MSIDIMSKTWKKSRQSGARLLALLALADRADEDGICWPGREWIAERARVQSGKNIRRIIRSLEEAGEIVYDPGRGRGRRTYYLVAIALEPEEIKEIAVRRFQMTEEDATFFVEGIVSRQLQHQLKNAPKDTPPKKKGAEEPPFNKKGGRGAPFSKKRAEEPPFNKKGGRRAREKGAVEPHKRGPYGPPDSSIDSSIDPLRENTSSLISNNIQQQHARVREAVVVAGDFLIWDAFRLAGIKARTAKRIPDAWKQSTGEDITPVDILAWHFYREAENLNLPAGRKLRPAFVIASLEAGDRADAEFYERAREYLADLQSEQAVEDLDASAEPDSPELSGLRRALEAYVPPVAEIGIEALDAMSRQLPEIAKSLHANGVTPDDLNDLHLYLAYTGQSVPRPEDVAETLAGAGPDFQSWRERKAEAERLWRRIVQQSNIARPGSAIDQAMRRAKPVDLNGSLVVMGSSDLEAYFQRIWPRRAAAILSETDFPEDLPIQFIPQ